MSIGNDFIHALRCCQIICEKLFQNDVAPQIQPMILHDQSGDNSYGYWESKYITETVMRFSVAQTISAGAWLNVKIDVDLVKGPVFP